MALLSLKNISIAFGGDKILDDLTLQLHKNQRICLLGRNGAGKSTLMKIISGEFAADSGTIQKDDSLKISYFSQDIPQDLTGSVFELIAGGLGERGNLFLRNEKYERQLKLNVSIDQDEFSRLHHQMDTIKAWSVPNEIKKITDQMSLNPDWQYEALSGGQKRRTLLAAALVSNPELLLLDEPTNHLDIQTIRWLEEYLLQFNTTLLFVTHDRMLLRRLATRIIELDRGNLVDWSCDYDTFLERKAAVLANEEKEWDAFDQKLAQEEIWIRKGIKARRTRNEGRVRALKKMREERKKRRYRDGNVSMSLIEAEKSGKIAILAKELSFSWEQEELISRFSTIISRGDKIGIIGPNGCGKTTLIKLLLQEYAADSGEIKHGNKLVVTYYDQMREQIDLEKNIWENVVPNGDSVIINGVKKHVITYLEEFLFTPERARTPVKQLSGGEKNRLLLAKLFTRAANLLVLDEPTNDLDAETLELLESLLVNFNGTVLLISHDRTFLNNVITSSFVFKGDGKIKEFVGGYDDWLRQDKPVDSATKTEAGTNKKEQYQTKKRNQQKKKRSYNEQRELKELPKKIEIMENRQTEIHAQMAKPDFYKMKEKAIELKSELDEIAEKLNHAYSRWEYLESFDD